MFNSSRRRQSLIPKLQFTSQNSSPLSSPNNSPTKVSPRRVNISPPSPSKLPIISSRKRISRSNSDYDLNEIFRHSHNDLELQRQELSGLSFNIDTLLATKYQLESEIRDMQRSIDKASNKIQEYEIGIPYNQSILEQQTNSIEAEIMQFQDKIKLEKENLKHLFSSKEIKFENDMKDLLADAHKDDDEAVAAQNKRIDDLKREKDDLLAQIDTAKEKLETAIVTFKASFTAKHEDATKHLNNQKLSIEEELKIASTECEQLLHRNNQLISKEDALKEQTNKLNFEVESKKTQIEKLQFKLLDIESLINSLKVDLDAASKLRNDFEQGEFTKSKDEWLRAKSKLDNERYKRLKIEIQIKEISGIPNIVILPNDKIEIFNDSKLAEFIKNEDAEDYEWELELLTSLESSLNGVSSLVLFCNEGESDVSQQMSKITQHLISVASNKQRFGSFESQIKTISYPELYELTKAKLTIPAESNCIHVLMTNMDSKTSRQAVIIVTYVNTSEKLSHYLPLVSKLQSFTIAQDVSNVWADSLSQIVARKPVRSRQSYSILNDE